MVLYFYLLSTFYKKNILKFRQQSPKRLTRWEHREPKILADVPRSDLGSRWGRNFKLRYGRMPCFAPAVPVIKKYKILPNPIKCLDNFTGLRFNREIYRVDHSTSQAGGLNKVYIVADFLRLEFSMLNLQSPVPLYHQLAQILMTAIHTGELLPGSKIPPETALAATHGIGRPTVRQAIEVLVNKGLVQRKRGSGTFVLEPRRKVDLFSLAGTSSAFQRQGIKTGVRILEPISLIRVVDDQENPFNEQDAYVFSRLTLAENEPVLIEDFFLQKSLFSGIETMDLSNLSLARVVEDRFYLKPVNGRQSFKIVTPGHCRARHLGIKDCDPILEVRRSIDFPDIKNGVYSKIFCRTDRFSFSQTLG